MDWPATRYRLNQRAFMPRVPGLDHELLPEGTEVISDLKPGPHMDPLTPEAEEAKARAGTQHLDFTQHQPLSIGDDDDLLAARVAKATATALAQMGMVPGAAAVQPETTALAAENEALKARLATIEDTLMRMAAAQASQANAAPPPPPAAKAPPPPAAKAPPPPAAKAPPPPPPTPKK